MSRSTVGRFKVAIIAAVLMLPLLPGAASAASVAKDAASAVANAPAGTTSWVVTLKPGHQPDREAPGLAKGAGGKVGMTYTHALKGFVFKGSAKGAAALAMNPNVRTVTPDGPIKLLADTIPTGVSRIRANHATASSAYADGFRGAGVKVAILDTGIDLTHPDLVANIDASLGLNCMTSGPPQDGHGHGTHVAGIVAADDNGFGVVGVAPDAQVVPIKVLDDTGQGEWSNLICAIDYLTGLITDNDPSNDVRVANMSLGDTGSIGSCDDGFVREALCTSVAAGITYVAAAGNSTVDTAGFIPAAMPEVIAVSALTDLDGEPGGKGGCWLWIFYCDDTLAEFSNYGASVDVTAPGTRIYSDWTGGGYQTEDGTSMAAPHVSGVVALMLSGRPGLSPADVMNLLKTTGECPNGQQANPTGDCAGKGQWTNDPDGIAEPLVNALRAAEGAGPYDARPTVHITSPANGDNVAGTVTITADASDETGVVSVEFLVNGRELAIDSDGTDGWSTSWDTSVLDAGVYTISAVVTDTASQSTTDQVSASTGTNPQGDWVGTYGADGYALLGWDGTSDLVSLPEATLTLDQGSRFAWASPSADVRALESPDTSERRATTWYDASGIQAHLTFGQAYTGTLHLYALDWDAVHRRQTVTVDDGSGPELVTLDADFDAGAWLHFPISVAANGQVTITANWLSPAGYNAVLAGLFLGGTGAPPPPPPPSPPAAPSLTASATSADVVLSWTVPDPGTSPIVGYNVYRSTSSGTETLLTGLDIATTYTDATVASGQRYYYRVTAESAAGEGAASQERSAQLPDLSGAQGDWVGTYGADGYALLGWDGTSDLVSLPEATLTLDQGSRFAWASPSADVRALESPDTSERRATTWYDASGIQAHLTFGQAYTGTLHLYALDWDAVTVARR